MSPQVDDAGGSRHRAPGPGAGRGFPAGAGPFERPGPRSTFGPETPSGAPTGGPGAGGPPTGGSHAGGPHGPGPNGGHGGPDNPAVDDVEVVEDALSVATRERDEYLDMVRRVQADFENYKKRMLRQQTDQLERASENLVAKLLPALDAFALTRAHMSDADVASPEVKALLQAAGLVDDALAKEGLERIDDPGAPFDPTVHDAVEHAPAAAGDTPGTAAGPVVAGPVVAEVLRPGYRWKGRVIRPAMVRVRG
jgi:molecular chaperone GrpE